MLGRGDAAARVGIWNDLFDRALKLFARHCYVSCAAAADDAHIAAYAHYRIAVRSAGVILFHFQYVAYTKFQYFRNKVSPPRSLQAAALQY